MGFLIGAGYYMFTFITDGRFTNMSALLFTTSVLVFLMGLVSEQITQLMYKDTGSPAPGDSQVQEGAVAAEDGEN